MVSQVIVCIRYKYIEDHATPELLRIGLRSVAYLA